MKKVILSFIAAGVLAGFSGSAEATTVSDICNRINTTDGIIRCMAAARGQACDERALTVCNRINSTEGLIGCVSAVAGKIYTNDEVNLCNRINTTNGIIECLAVAGRPRHGDHGERDNIKDMARILRDMINNDRLEAEQKLRRLERRLGM